MQAESEVMRMLSRECNKDRELFSASKSLMINLAFAQTINSREVCEKPPES